jgi:hypothetical protein
MAEITLTAFNRVRFRVIAHEGCLRLVDLHQTVLLDLGKSDILLVPLQAVAGFHSIRMWQAPSHHSLTVVLEG